MRALLSQVLPTPNLGPGPLSMCSGTCGNGPDPGLPQACCGWEPYSPGQHTAVPVISLNVALPPETPGNVLPRTRSQAACHVDWSPS